MQTNEYEFLNLDIDDGIATITLDHPPLNILHNAMLDEFNAALNAVTSESDVVAIVIRAEGRAFSAGVDVGDHGPEQVATMIERFHGIFRKLAATDALTIAAVDGAALGGGCELACFCDVLLASDRVKLGLPEVQVGVFPPVAACILPLQIGIRRAVELVTLGETVKAEEALRLGLVSHVFPVDEFDRSVEAYLTKLRRLSRPVVRLAKKATMLAAREQVLEHLERAESLYLNDLMALADTREGIAAFVDKRSPQWCHA